MRDLFRTQTTQRAQRQGDLSLKRQSWMAAGKNQSQPVVTDFILAQHALFRFGEVLFYLGKPLEFVALGIEARPPPQQVYSLVVRGGNQPRSRIIGRALLRPLFDRNREGFLHYLFGQIEAAEQANQGRQNSPRLLPVNAFDVHPATRTQSSRIRRRETRACHAEQSDEPRSIPNARSAAAPPIRWLHPDPWRRPGSSHPVAPWFPQTDRR